MWPFDRSQRDVLRVGRHALEHWVHASGGLTLRNAVALPTDKTLDARTLCDALLQLGNALSGRDGEPRIEVVVESAWMPVLAVPLQGPWWPRRKLDALVRHHLQQLYGAPHSGAWAVQTDYRAGTPLALGFALDPAVLSAVTESIGGAGLRVASLQPAFGWGWQRFAAERRHARSDWFIWIEQDRSLVCELQQGQVVSLDAGAAAPTDQAQARRAIEVACMRRGRASAGRALVTGWQPLRPADSASVVSLRTIAVASSDASVPATRPRQLASAG